MSFFTVHFRMKHVFSEAEGYLELGMPEHALKVLDRGDDLSPGYRADILYLRAEALRELDRYEEAIAVLQEAVESNPMDIRFRLSLGWCYLGLDSPLDALDVLEGADKHAFECRKQVYFLKGIALRDLERYEEAAEVLTKALDEHSDDIRTRLALGWCYLGLQQPEKTLDVLDAVQEVSEEHATQLLFLQGVALRDLNRYQEALSPLRAASKLDPKNIHIWLAIGWCYKRMKRMDQAIESLELALHANDSDPLIPYNLACYWSVAGNSELALSFLSRAIQMDPSYLQLVPSEPDFECLRTEEQFLELTKSVA